MFVTADVPLWVGSDPRTAGLLSTLKVKDHGLLGARYVVEGTLLLYVPLNETSKLRAGSVEQKATSARARRIWHLPSNRSGAILPRDVGHATSGWLVQCRRNRAARSGRHFRSRRPVFPTVDFES